MVKAIWNGEWPCLCYGEWTLIVDGKDVSDHIPDELRNSHMNTYGTYYRWYFDDNYLEDWEPYEDGLEKEAWIEENEDWLSTITDSKDTWADIFDAISMQDFRHGSCGGCI